VFMGINLIGRYRIDKANLQKSDLHLVVATRKPAPNKPNFYLLQRIGSQHRHISGLFPSKITPGSPQEAQIFDFDYQGGYYVLKIDQSTGQAEIDFKGEDKGRGNPADSYNIAGLGSKSYPGDGGVIAHNKTGGDAAI